MIFDDLATKYHTRIDYTPVGERYLADHMNILMNQDIQKTHLVFGGEGSCGGVMLPTFNNTRDGIFAAIKIAELLIKTKRPLSELVDQLPKYVSLRKNIQIKGENVSVLMKKLRTTLTTQNLQFEIIDNDVKLKGEKEWTLVHPSNTEPIIRIITEAKTEVQAQKLLDQMDQLLNKLWKKS
jgi:phosphomannomutase